MGSQQQQQFCLRWNNHQTNLLSVFDDLLQHETLVDVTLACEGLSMRAHKVVLSACSPYFQQLFLENPCKHPIVVLKDIRYTDMKTLVDFMYKGEVNVSHDQLSTLLNVADTLKVKGLAEVTEGMAANTGRRNDTEMPPVLEVQSGTASRRGGGGGGAGAISPTTSRRRKRRRTSGGSNSGLSEDVDSRTGVVGGVTGANDLTSDTMAQQHKQQQQQQRLPHSMDLPVVPKMEVIQMPYDEEEEEQQREESRREQEEEEEENAEENMPTLRVLDVRGGRDVHGSKVVGGGDGGSVPGLSTGTASSSYSRLNTTGIETTKDRHGRDDNGIEDDEKYVNLNEDDDDDGIEITDLPFTQHLTIEPTASTSALALMGQGPSTSSGPHPNTTTECSLYFPSTSSSSSLPMYDASNMPSASNTQVHHPHPHRHHHHPPPPHHHRVVTDEDGGVRQARYPISRRYLSKHNVTENRPSVVSSTGSRNLRSNSSSQQPPPPPNPIKLSAHDLIRIKWCRTYSRMTSSLMNHLFTKQEMATSCVTGKSLSGKDALDKNKVQFVVDFITQQFNVSPALVRMQMAQKCKNSTNSLKSLPSVKQ